jgi:hypothetical protein
VILAGSKDAVGKGVVVALNDQINAGRDVTKTNTSILDTFRTPDLGLLGYMQDNRPHFFEGKRGRGRIKFLELRNSSSLSYRDYVTWHFRACRSTPGLPRFRISVAVETANNYGDSGLDAKV